MRLTYCRKVGFRLINIRPKPPSHRSLWQRICNSDGSLSVMKLFFLRYAIVQTLKNHNFTYITLAESLWFWQTVSLRKLYFFLRYAIQQNWNIMVGLEIDHRSKLSTIYMPCSVKRYRKRFWMGRQCFKVFLTIHKS